MKYQLFGSTALAVIGLLAPAVRAADGITLHLGGRYMGAAGVVPSEDFSPSSGVSDSDVRNYVFKQDVRVYFEGESTLDNGLQVGARVDLRGQTDTTDQIRDVYAYFSGGFGEVRFGDTSEAYAQMCYLVPSASALFGADSPNFNFSNAGIAGAGATNGTCYGIDSNSTKVVYFSPTFAGFQFAASFTPDNTEDTRNTLDGAATRLRNDPGQNSENLSLAGTFKQDFNGVNLVLGGGTTYSFNKEANPNNTDDARSYNGYAQVGFAGFTFGASTELRDNFGDTSADQGLAPAAPTTGTPGRSGSLDSRRLREGHRRQRRRAVQRRPRHLLGYASYALGPGIQVDGVLEYSDYHSRNAAGPDYQGVGAGLGTLMTF